MNKTQSLGPLLGCVSHLAKGGMDARVARYDVTPSQAHVLLYLCHHGGQAPQAELTEHLMVKPSTANGILDRMVEKGLVERTVHGKDARQRIITLTEAGRERKQRLKEGFLETEAVMIRGFTPEEERTLHELLGRVIENLKEDQNP